MYAYLRSYFHLAHLTEMLRLLGLTVFLGLLVSEFSVVHDATYGRLRSWSHLDEVQPTFPGQIHGLRYGHNAQLHSLLVHNPHLSSPDPLINAQFNYKVYPSPMRAYSSHMIAEPEYSILC